MKFKGYTMSTQPEKAKQLSVRLSPDAWKLLTTMAKDMGLTMTGVIELAIRALAEKEGLR
jgi:hypothetical protein